MKKIFCDVHPQNECGSRMGNLRLSVIHQTNKGEVIGEDEYRSRDLCGVCVDEIVKAYFGGQLPISHQAIDRDSIVNERAMVARNEGAW